MRMALSLVLQAMFLATENFEDAADGGQVIMMADTHWKKMALPWMTSESTTFWFRVGSLFETREDDAAISVLISISFDCKVTTTPALIPVPTPG